MVSIRQLYYLQRDGQHILSSGNYIIFSAMVSIRQLYYLQRDGQHKAIILSVTTIFSAMVSIYYLQRDGQLYYLQRDGQRKAIILIVIFSAMVNIYYLQRDGQRKAIILIRWTTYLQCDGQHKAIILSAMDRQHIFGVMVSIIIKAVDKNCGLMLCVKTNLSDLLISTLMWNLVFNDSWFIVRWRQ